jgi:hypothetical protein
MGINESSEIDLKWSQCFGSVLEELGEGWPLSFLTIVKCSNKKPPTAIFDDGSITFEWNLGSGNLLRNVLMIGIEEDHYVVFVKDHLSHGDLYIERSLVNILDLIPRI